MKKLLFILLFLPLLFNCNSDIKQQEHDFISNVDWHSILLDELSIDFHQELIFGNQMYELKKICNQNDMSVYDAQKKWWNFLNADNYDLKIDNAFVNQSTFYLRKDIYDSTIYEPYESGYEYYIGLEVFGGFAFNDMKKNIDINNDGFLDREIQYTFYDQHSARYLFLEYSKECFYTFWDSLGRAPSKKEEEEWYEGNFPKFYNYYEGTGYITKYEKEGMYYLLINKNGNWESARDI